MIHYLLILTLILIFQTYLFLYFYDNIEMKNYEKEKKYLELLLIIIITGITSFLFLMNKTTLKNIIIIVGIFELFFISFWLFLNYIYDSGNSSTKPVALNEEIISDNGIIVDKEWDNNKINKLKENNIDNINNNSNNIVPSNEYDFNNNNVNNEDVEMENNVEMENTNKSLLTKILNIFSINKPTRKKIKKPYKINNTEQVFSKYINNDRSDFTFHKLYPKQTKDIKNDAKSVKDYSAYNGYNENSICHNCKCIKNESGDIFCGKSVSGFGVIGCSEKWECNSCKDCQSWDDKNNDNKEKKISNNVEDKKYECKNCKCRDTIGGKVCGKRSRIDGQFIKCKEHCVNCGDCNTNKSVSNGNYITYYPKKKININDIIINNISNVDIDNIM